MHSSHGAQSPRAHETASSYVCGIGVGMIAGVSTRNRAPMEKSSLVVVESLCDAIVTLFGRLD